MHYNGAVSLITYNYTKIRYYHVTTINFMLLTGDPDSTMIKQI